MVYRAVGVIGNPNNINCWSNIPYFFLQAGKKVGFFQTGLPLNPRQWNHRFHWLFWNISSPLRGEKYGGFQYTRQANEALLKQVDLSNITEIISHFQLFPPYELCHKHGISFAHYIDFPLPCLFDDYKTAEIIGYRTAQNALAREREQYMSARYVVCMSSWAAQQVIEHCQVPADKVHAIIPGANLPETAFDNHNTEPLPLGEPPDGKQIPLRIAFVGKVPLRKGLDRLVTGIRILRQRGYKTTVRVIGPSENLFPNDPEIEHLGFINKLQEPLRLVQELQSCHMGALPSYQEAFGIAALEYLRCGLPALITQTGGLQDSLPPDCRIMLPADCTGLDIADAIESLFKNPEHFQQLRLNTLKKATYASWDRTIRDFQKLWNSDRTNSLTEIV